MGIRLQYATRNTTQTEQRMQRARPRFKSQIEFPGGRVIKLASTVLRREAKRVAQTAAAQAYVQQAVATGQGSVAAAHVGGGGGGATAGRSLPGAALV